MKAVDSSTATYPSVMTFLKNSKSPEGSPCNGDSSSFSSDSHMPQAIPTSQPPSTKNAIEASILQLTGALDDEYPVETTPYKENANPSNQMQSRGGSSIDPEEFLRLRGECLDLEQRLCQCQDELQLSREMWHKQAEEFNSKLTRAGKTITQLLIDQARREFIEMRRKLISDQERLGRFVNTPVMVGNGAPPSSTTAARGCYWEGGSEEEAISAALQQLEIDRADIEREKIASRKMRRSTNLLSNSNSNSGNNSSSMSMSMISMMPPFGDQTSHPTRVVDATEVEHLLNDTKESLAMAEGILKRTEEQIKERQRKLHAERIAYIKQLKTYRAQEDSTFNSYPRLGNMERYQLLNMLGKGGFSEVYKAYDLFNHCFVAIKIHEIRKDMEELARQNYVRHTTSEYNIHKRLKHRRIVRLLDCFSIDVMSFGVAMEYCEGVDLDTHLKAHGPMPEKEARGVIIQVLSALRYLNTPPNKVIHYDIKPGNILYNKGQVKIADFGLSKTVDHSITNGHDTIELTSQGAGTYYYLPPECFSGINTPSASSVHAPPNAALKVSNKVDVWSIGVVFYELLFAKKPFGDGQSQEHILRTASTIFNPNADIVFPSRISKQAEEFIRRLLTYDVRRRPDVIEASNDPYVFPATACLSSTLVNSAIR